MSLTAEDKTIMLREYLLSKWRTLHHQEAVIDQEGRQLVCHALLYRHIYHFKTQRQMVEDLKGLLVDLRLRGVISEDLARLTVQAVGEPEIT